MDHEGLSEVDSRGKNHVVDKLVAQTPQLERYLDRDEGKDDLESAHPPDSGLEPLDVFRVVLDQLGREEVCPELRVSSL